jgi:predicted Zn-ribbon and HTH transcriptional regulator
MDLEIIIRHYLIFGGFLNLKRVNIASNQKLISVCKKYLSDQPNSIIIPVFDFKEDEFPVETKEFSTHEIEEFCNSDKIKDVCESEKLNIVSDSMLQISENENILKGMKIEISNYKLHELAQIEGLSVRTINVCKRYELINLEKILHYYYVEKENFKHLRNCGKKSIEELVGLCEKYRRSIINTSDIHVASSKTKMLADVNHGECFPSDILETTFYELEKNENLSIRSQNVCRDNGMTDLSSIITYYWANKNFLKLKNCGQKSNLELIEICKKFETRIEKPIKVFLDAKPLNSLILKIDSLTVKQKQIINNLLVSKFSELPVRPQNALNALLNNDITLKNFCDTIFSDPEFDINTIRNIGEKSEIEINAFLEVLKEQIEIVLGCQDEREIEIKLCETFLIKNFSIIDTTIFQTIEGYNFADGLPLFRIIKLLVDNDILFEVRKKQIFNNEFCSMDEKESKSLNDLSIELGVTRERVRQIRDKFLGKFESCFRFITQPEIKNLVNYNIDLSSYFIDISDELIDRINTLEKVKFNRLFINRIFGCLYSANFELVGSVSQNIHEKDIAIDKWKRSYLIDKRITALFDFEKFYDDIKSRISDRIEEDYSFYFQTYLMNFLKSSKYEMLENLVDITEYMLLNEFEIILDTNENIVFKRNTKKQVIEYVHEVLAKKNEPMTVYEIYDLIQKNHPGVTKSAEAVRGSCQRDSRLIFFGRSSTYGLKVWEDKLDIRGGTIREIAAGFLQNQTEPKHIDEITEYVNKYRNTNSKSVYSNLKVDEQKRFVFFCGQLIGLSSKEYSLGKYQETNDLNIDRKSWEENFLDLKKFAEENNRLPSSTGVNPEDRLYRFMNIQLRKAAKEQIDGQKSLRINELVSKYEYKKGTRQLSEKWNNRYSELKKFIMTNNRLPKVGLEDEKLLYYFLSNQRRLYSEDSLPLNFVEKLFEIAKLLN